MTLAFTIPCADAEYINGDLRIPKQNNVPLIFILHGFKGFKDWAFFPYVAEELTKAGAITVCANTSHNGHKPGSDIVDYPDKFAQNTIGRELSDTTLLIKSFIEKSPHVFPEQWSDKWNGSIYILGHSRGGAIAILSAESIPAISKVALWNSIANVDRYTPRQKEQWHKNDMFVVENSRTGQELCMNVDYLIDLELHAEQYSLERALSEMQQNIIIVHGEQDMTVNVRDAQKLAQFAGNKAHIKFIPNTGHTFGAVHPMVDIPAGLIQALKSTKEFFFQ